MRKLVGILIILVLLGVAYFGYGLTKGHSERSTVRADNKISLQLLPFPLIIANDGSKNDSLLELLLNKDKKIITVHDGNLEFANILPLGSKVSFESVSLDFAYDQQENKVKFSGNINDAINTKISGEYYLNDKNNIVYNLKFDSALYNIIISGNYKFVEEQGDSGVLEGSFSCDLTGLNKFFKSTDLSFNSKAADSFTANGDYVYQDNKFKISNAVVKHDNIDLLFGVDFNNDVSPALAVDFSINHLNFDNLIDLNELSSEDVSKLKMHFSHYIKEVLNQYSESGLFSIKGSGTKILINGADLTNLSVDIASKPETGFLVNKFNFSLFGDSNFASSGVINSNKYRPEFIGNLSVDTKGLNKLVHYFDSTLDILELQDNISISANSQLLITPILISLSELTFKGNDGGVIVGNWFFSNYGLQRVVHSDFNISNFTIGSSSVEKGGILKDLVRRSNEPDFVDHLMKLKLIQIAHDCDLQLNNVLLDEVLFNQLSCEAVLRPNFFELNGIKVKSDTLKFSGDASMNVAGVNPFIGVTLNGDLFSADFMQYVSSFKEAKADESNQTEKVDASFELFRFDKFTGYFQLNFVKLVSKLVEANNFNFFASIKDGLMNIEKLNADVLGGHFQGLGSMSLDPFKTNFSYSFADFDLSQLGGGQLNNEMVSGNASSVGKFSSSGSSLKELMKNLNGEVKIQSNNLLVNKFNIGSLVAMYGKSQKSDIGKKINIATGSTLFSSIGGDIKIDSGVFVSDKISFETDSNINGATSFNFQLTDYVMNSITSIAYIDQDGNVDGFNVSLNGPLGKLKMQLGSGSKSN